MGNKKRHQRKTRLTSRNALDALNGLIEFTNVLLADKERLHSVHTPRDLFELRQKVKSLPTSASNNGGNSERIEEIRKVEVVPARVLQAFAAIATNAWRTRNKMTDEDTGEAKDEMKRAYRHVEALFEALSEIGIEIRDMQGRAFDSGMALKVISFEPTPGLSREEIAETIKPTVTWQDQLIQMGEVIVGTPDGK
jgi:hypothetical protein